jgi:hypothetical protein
MSHNVPAYAMFFARFIIILSKEKGKKYGRGLSGKARTAYAVLYDVIKNKADQREGCIWGNLFFEKFFYGRRSLIVGTTLY